MLKYHIINLASCRLCPRRAAGGKERRYMDQNDKNKSNKNNDRRKGVLSLLIWALVLTIGFNYLLSAMDTRKLAESTCEIRYDEFLDLVRDGKVKEVEIADRTLNITPVDGFTYTDADGKTYSGDFQLFTTQINDPELRSFLDENGVEFGKPYKAETSYLEIIMLNYVLPTALMVGAFILMMRFISKKTGGGGFGGLGSVGKSNAKVYMEKSTGVTFADVAGQDEAKESLVEIIDFLHNPQKYTDIGAKLPRGALLVGPPGTGKFFRDRMQWFDYPVKLRKRYDSEIIIGIATNNTIIFSEWNRQQSRNVVRWAILNPLIFTNNIQDIQM